ncbi:motility protein A [Pseudobacteriovorax antillogorgiicola]|uniref:Chemotaxis protein MotA n=1 Tax=Pseudobacteriovorax antillogorgiicola TaxID=1513793 RepID=A0A1Y6BDR7_9BACT|nr:MotA/TolQ/ExbB proton channel family protein [Pseudobacteriovorax antillogorgiicola]TCS56384.1 chemotaxis protein MotA [Pseudobacteriovorax antillogorgiicola]SMF06346.1 chemotaxis protein MotA [Pseudobacteriovorax antillogorgiicola]
MDGLNLKKYLMTSRKRFDPIALVISIIGLVAVVFSIAAKESLQSYFDLRSILVVVVGTFASLLFQFDFGTSIYSLRLVIMSFLGTPEKKIIDTIHQIDEAILEDMKLQDLREGDNINGELLNDIVYMFKQGLLFEEIDEFVTSRVSDEFLGRKVAVDLLRRAAIIAPALGLFGTVIGLIGVLKSLSDPSQIGPSMSLALMTTAYGAGIGSLIFTPLAGRLEHHNTIYLEVHQQILSKIAILLKRDERNPKSEFKPEGVS